MNNTFYQCKSGECLQRSLVCNNIMECEDGSDEQSCGLCIIYIYIFKL